VPRNARACPNCGADERSGWNEEGTLYDGIDLPDHAFENSDRPRRSLGPNRFTRVLWVVVAVVAGVALLALLLR
jgi:hypothetical protein